MGANRGSCINLLSIIDQKFVEDVDRTALEDAAAEAMLKATETDGAIISPHPSIRPT